MIAYFQEEVKRIKEKNFSHTAVMKKFLKSGASLILCLGLLMGATACDMHVTPQNMPEKMTETEQTEKNSTPSKPAKETTSDRPDCPKEEKDDCPDCPNGEKDDCPDCPKEQKGFENGKKRKAKTHILPEKDRRVIFPRPPLQPVPLPEPDFGL